MGLRNMRGKWQYRFRLHGQDVCVTTDHAATERERKKAEAEEAAHRHRIREGQWGARPLKPRVLLDVLPEFQAWCGVEYAQHPATARRIETSMASVRRFFGRRQLVSMVTPGDIERYKVDRLTRESRKPVTVKHDLDNLSVFFQWAVRCEYARTNPTRDVSRPSDAGAVRQYVLSEDDERRYFAAARGNLAAVGRIILAQGMRPEEVMGRHRDDVDLAGGHIYIRGGKTAAARRSLLIADDARPILEAQLEKGSPWLFPSNRRPGKHITKLNCAHERVLQKLNPCRACGLIEAKHPTLTCDYVEPTDRLQFVLYDLRHTFATRMAESGADPFALAAILGHASTAVLGRYVHPTQRHMDSAMRGLGDRKRGGLGSES